MIFGVNIGQCVAHLPPTCRLAQIFGLKNSVSFPTGITLSDFHFLRNLVKFFGSVDEMGD
jgi:hypothetical protein